MILNILILLPLVSNSAIWCGSQDCTNCTSGFNFKSKMCISECPTGYMASLSEMKCISSSNLTLVDFEIDDSYPFNTSNISGFASIDGVPFMNESMRYPMITKDRGLFFNSTSQIEASEGWVLSPDHRIAYMIRCFKPGQILRILLRDETLLSVTWNTIELTHSYLLTTNGSSSIQGCSMRYTGGWILIGANAMFESNTYKILLSHVDFRAFSRFEFRGQNSNCTFVLGSNTNSFVGFLKRFQIQNSNSGEIFSHGITNYCGYTEYIFNLKCYECNSSCPTYPICTRNSCNLCYSSNCSSCSGYLISDCLECSSGEPSQCSSDDENCMIGSMLNCSVCKTEYTLNQGICTNLIYNPENINIISSLSPVINAKFNVFSQFYDIFQSGNNPSTWHPYENPESDDPVHYTMRGIYIQKDKLNFMKTNISVTLNYNFSIAIWFYNFKGGIFLFKDSLYFFDQTLVELRLRNSEEFAKFRSSHAVGNMNNWCLFGASVYFDGKITTLFTSLNFVLYKSLTISGYFFFDKPSPLYIGNNIQTRCNLFYYSVTVWQTFITNFSIIKDICGGGIYAGCLWNCSELYYYNTLDKKCRICSNMCFEGCSTFGSCSKCFNISCADCSTFTDSYTCDENKQTTPCIQGSLYINNTKCCPFECLNCFGDSVLKCFWCTSEYSLLGTICYKTCPLGFKSLNSICILIDQSMIYEVNFNGFESVVSSLNQRVNFSVPYPSQFYKTMNVNNPRPALNRGYYFTSNSYMNSNIFDIPYNFTIIFWIKVSNDGVLFSRNGLIVYTNQYLTLNGSDYNLNFDSSINWKIFQFTAKTEFNGNHVMNIQIVEKSPFFKWFWIPDSYFFDGGQILQIGNEASSFEGFIWKSRLYYQYYIESSNSLVMCSATQSFQCLVSCSIELFFNGSTCDVCPTCPLGCVRASDCNLCSDPICEECIDFSSVCSKCFNNSSLQATKCVCNSGYYWNQSRLMCAKCLDPCIQCSEELKCSICQDNSLIFDNFCVCRAGFYLNISGNCESCHPECLNCTGRSNLECISCPNNSILHSNHSCKCNIGYFWNGSGCEECHFLCKSCFSKSLNSCLSCKNNMILTLNQSCSCSSSQYLENDSCINCDSTCLECIGEGAKNCSLCKTNAVLLNNSCNCHELLFMINGECESCHKTCLKCSGTKRNQCLVCNYGLILQSSGQCWCQQGNYWDEATEKCLNCSQKCLECNSIYRSDCYACSEECFFCQDFSKFINDSCRCLTGYYSYNNECLKCNESCVECFDKYFYSCTVCSHSYLNGICYENCPVGSSLINGECLFSEPLVLLRFQDDVLKVSDNLNRVITKKCKNYNPNQGLIPAVPFIYRGGYFNGENSCVQVSPVESDIRVLSNTFEFSIWILTYKVGPILQLINSDLKNWDLDLRFTEESVNLSISLNSYKYFYAMNQTSLFSQWLFLRIKLEFFNISIITIELESIAIQFTNPAPFVTENSLLYLGRDLATSLSGFVYQVTLNNFKWQVRFSYCDECSSCPVEHVCLPSCNNTQYFNQTTRECLSCNEGCLNGCRNNLKCGMCFDFACITCKGFDEFSCLSCEDGFIVINGTCQECPAGHYFNSKTKTCDSCYFLCGNCSKINICESCIENAWLSGETCSCIKGFKVQNKQCRISYFFVQISLSFSNEVTLIFTEGLETNLLENDLEVFINQDISSYKIKKIHSTIYVLELDESNINKDSYVYINFLVIYSETYSILYNKTVRAKLFYEDKSAILLKIEESKQYGKTGSSIGLSISVFSGILSMDISSIFNFLNFAEIYSVIALYGTPIPNDLLEFLRSLRINKMIPNVFEIIIGKDSKKTLNPLFSSFGFSSNKMVVNSGISLMVLVVILTLFIIQRFSLNLFVKKYPKLDFIREYFYYKVFVEYWLQTCFEFLITSSYSLSLSTWDNPWDALDYVLSCIMLVIFKQSVQMLAFVLSCFVFFKRSKSSDEEKKKIDEKFGYLFVKFTGYSNFSLTFHYVFFCRRVLMVALLFSPVSTEFRLILSSLISISVRFKKMVVYLSSSLGFSSHLMNFLHISNEIITLAVHMVVFGYLLELNFLRNSVTSICMNLVTASWGLNTICSLSHIIKILLTKLISKFRKNSKVETEVNTEYYMRNKPLKITEMIT